MKTAPGEFDDLDRLIWAFGNQTISADDFARLESLLRESTLARRHFAIYLNVQSLCERYSEDLGETRSASSHPVTQPPTSLFTPSARPRFAPSTLVWSILAASVLFAAYFIGISWNMLGKQLAQGTGDREQGTGKSEIRSPKSEIESVATITASEDAVWSPDSEIPSNPRPRPGAKWSDPKSAITPGQPLSIASGLVELQLKQGATLLIEGPADWQITGDNSATLKQGKLVAKVPQQAVGFTLETPTAKIVDLGTEFGVEVKESGESGVQVVRGKVEVQQQGKPGAKLGEGQSVHISHAGIKSTQQDLSRFSALLERGGDGPALERMPDVDLRIDMLKHFKLDWNNAQAWGGEIPRPGRRYHVGKSSSQTLRSPYAVRPQPFGGSELVVHKLGMLGLKHSGSSKLDLLTLNGGVLNASGSPAGTSEPALAGRIRVMDDSIIRLGSVNSMTLAAQLEGHGNLTVDVVDGSGRLTLLGDGTRFDGRWRIQGAKVVALSLGSLGNGSVSLENKGVLDLRYRWNSPKAQLSLAKGASFALGFSATLGELLVDGSPVPAGTHTLKELKAMYPGYFAGADDSLTVEIVGPPEVAKPKT